MRQSEQVAEIEDIIRDYSQEVDHQDAEGEDYDEGDPNDVDAQDNGEGEQNYNDDHYYDQEQDDAGEKDHDEGEIDEDQLHLQETNSYENQDKDNNDDIDQDEEEDQIVHQIDAGRIDDNNANLQHPNPLHKSNHGSNLYQQYLQEKNAEAIKASDVQNKFINPLNELPNPDGRQIDTPSNDPSKANNQSFTSVPNQALPMLEEANDSKIYSSPMNKSYETREIRAKIFQERYDDFEKNQTTYVPPARSQQNSLRDQDLEAQLLQLQSQSLIKNQNSERRIYELQQELQKERSETQYKIGFLLRQKQEAEGKMYQQQETIRKYAHAVEQMQRESESEKQMLNQNSYIIDQYKAREEELRNQLESADYKLSETESDMLIHSDELISLRTENENLQIDLKSLVKIEQALRTELNSSYQKMASMEQYIQQFNAKMIEMQQQLSESMNENENMKQDLMQFHKTIEMGSKENYGLKQEVQALREELLKKHQDNNQSTSSLADKDNEIFTLKAELARTKALVATKTTTNEGLSVDHLLTQNSDSFASDYLRNMHMKAQEERSNFFNEYPPAETNNKPNQFGYTSQSSYPTNQNLSSIQFLLQDPNEKVKKVGPKPTTGFPSGSLYK
jgi:hypothetical protein